MRVKWDSSLVGISTSIIELCEQLWSGVKKKTVAYADDIAVITTNTNEAIKAIFREYDKLTKSSGLALNADKTEILNLSENGNSTTWVQYDSLNLEIKHCESTTVCGNYLSLDFNKMYEKNTLDKITKLETQLTRWKGRNLSLNGKMMIIKTFAISQLIFTSQFQNIRPKDMRKIEHLCYTFAWNGRDRVRRAVIKSDRSKGGINGIDVEAFFKSIAVRQFIKSDVDPRIKILNRNSSVKEDIKHLARETIRAILLKQTSNIELYEGEYVLRTEASLFIKTYSKLHSLFESTDLTTLASINFESMTRSVANKIRRGLAPSVLTLIDRQRDDRNLNLQLSMKYENKWHDFSKLTGKMLNFIIKENRNKIDDYNVADRFKIDNSYFGDIRNTWQNLWLIKNPTLRAIRLKVLHKDIWTNEKCFRFKIAEDDRCIICGESETIFHQLFICRNAHRLWDTLEKVLGSECPSNDRQYAQCISVSQDYLVETIKSCIFKLLIQIDRSKDMTNAQVNRYLMYWIKIELDAINRLYNKNNYHLRRVSKVLSFLSSESR